MLGETLKGFVILLLIFSISVGAVMAQGLGGDLILPNSPLYGLDIFLERLELFITADPMDRVRLNMGFAKERLQELEALSGSNPRADDVLKAEDEYSREMQEVRKAFEQTRGDGSIERLQEDAVIETELRGQMVFIGRLKAALEGSPAGEGMLEVAGRIEDRVTAMRGEVLSAMEDDKAAASKAGETDEAIRDAVGKKEVETKVRLALEEGIKRDELDKITSAQVTPGNGTSGKVTVEKVPETTPPKATPQPNVTAAQGPKLVLVSPFTLSSERIHRDSTVYVTGTFRNEGNAPMNFTIKANARLRGTLTSEIPLEFYRGDEVFHVEPGKELTITREFLIPAFIPTGTYDVYGFVAEETSIWQTFVIEVLP